MSEDLLRDDLFRTCGFFTWLLQIDRTDEDSYAKVMSVLTATAGFVNGEKDHNVISVFRRCANCFLDMNDHRGFYDRIKEAGRSSEEFAKHVMYTLGSIHGSAKALGIEARPELPDFYYKTMFLMDLTEEQGVDAYLKGTDIGYKLVCYGKFCSVNWSEQQ